MMITNRLAKRVAKGDEEDRISELPEPISHHILSLLSQRKAVRACVLSKTWHHLVSTRPDFTLREKWFAQDEQALFHSVLETTLQRYLDQKLSIRALVLEFSNNNDVSQSLSLLEKWAPTIFMRLGVEVFDLSLTDSYSATFDLPESKTLRELYLERCNISKNNNIADKVLFRHLERLYLEHVYVSDETFEKIMSSCPLIEFLVLQRYRGLENIKVTNNKHLSVIDFCCSFFVDNYPSIEIDHIPAIESISIERCSNLVYHQKSFPHLVSLDLDTVRLCSKSLDIFSSNFPCLEKLSITACRGFKELKLLTRSIKHLTVKYCELIEVTIDAPNILSFKYVISGFLPSSISFTTTTPSECKSEIYLLNSGKGDGGLLAWALKLNGLLKALSQSQVSMNLSYPPLRDDQHVEGADCGGFYEHVVVDDLSLRRNSSNSSFPAFLNLLFRICRPRYLSRSWHIGNKHINNKQLFKILVKDRESRDNNDNFWRQDLEQVIVETSDDCGKTWLHRVGEKSFRKENDARFRLKWRN